MVKCAQRAGLPTLRRGRPVLAALSSVVLLACSAHSGGHGSEEDGGSVREVDPIGAAATDAGPEWGSRSDAATTAYRVRLLASPATQVLCPGSCFDLIAIAEGGVPPYTYTFDPNIGGGTGTRRVCPTATATYRVTANDGSFEGEFGGKNPVVTASLTIEVAAQCGDAGRAPLDAAVDATVTSLDASVREDGALALTDASGVGETGVDAASPPVPLGAETCAVPIATLDTAKSPDGYFDFWDDDFSTKLAVDPQDRLTFALTFRGSITMMDGTTLSSGSGDAILVGKLTTDCKLAWSRRLQVRQGTYEPTLAVDSKGRIVVLASAPTALAGGFPPSAIYLTALAAEGGATLWEQFFESAPGLQWQRALRVDANDDLVLMTAAAAGTNFGGGPMGTAALSSLDLSVEVLAKFRVADGGFVWSKLLHDGPTRASLAIQSGTDLVFHGWSAHACSWGGGGRTGGTQSGGSHGYLVRASAAGAFTWSQTVSDGTAEQFTWHWLDALENNQLVMSNFAVDGNLTLTDYNGRSLWKKLVIDPAAGLAEHWSKTNVDAQGGILLGGTFDERTAVNRVALSARQESGRDAFIQKLDANGAVRWTYQSRDFASGPASSEVLLGTAPDSQGNAFAIFNVRGTDSQRLWGVRLAR